MVHAQLAEAAKRAADRSSTDEQRTAGWLPRQLRSLLSSAVRDNGNETAHNRTYRAASRARNSLVSLRRVWILAILAAVSLDPLFFSPLALLSRSPVWRLSSVRNAQRCGRSLAGEMPAGEARPARPTPQRVRHPSACVNVAAPKTQADRSKHVSRGACTRDQRHAHTHCVRRRRPWGCHDGD